MSSCLSVWVCIAKTSHNLQTPSPVNPLRNSAHHESFDHQYLVTAGFHCARRRHCSQHGRTCSRAVADPQNWHDLLRKQYGENQRHGQLPRRNGFLCGADQTGGINGAKVPYKVVLRWPQASLTSTWYVAQGHNAKRADTGLAAMSAYRSAS